MQILIAGGTGQIGRALTTELCGHGHEVTLLTRSASAIAPRAGVRSVQWNALPSGPWTSAIDGADAVINLAGENLGGGRWTRSRKRRIIASRVETTRALAQAIAHAKNPPRVFLSASAVGYYGNVPDGDVPESAPKGIGFLADVCDAWEREAMRAASSRVRVVLLRSAVVLDPAAGALKRMLLPFRLLAGGPLGSGRQWFPWIHPTDEAGAIRFLLGHPSASGPFNLVAPAAVTMREFARTLGRVMRRPSWTPVPAFVLRTVLGEMASMVLGGQRAVPMRLLELGYRFRFAELEGALRDLLKERRRSTSV